MRPTLRLIPLVTACLIAPAAWSADALTDAMQAAYPPYRAALFRTNGKSVPDAQEAIVQAQQAWKALIERHGARPPAPYDRDPQVAATLAEVAKVYDTAAAQIRDGKLPAAHETLEAARDLMADLRRRNQVVVFSDHMNAYHSEMEHLLEAGPKLLAEPQGLHKLTARVGALDYLAARLRAETPAALRGNADYETALSTLESSVAAARLAALAQDAAALREALGKLKPAYSRLFLKFG